MRHIFGTMGTMVSLTMGDDSAFSIAEIEGIFHEADMRYSLHRDDSELARVASGILLLRDASTELLGTYAAALDWRTLTDGAFNPNRPDGVIDLNGIVKAMAIQQAGEELEAVGCSNWSLNVGGDILVAGTAAESMPWTTGITDPAHRGSLACAVEFNGSRRAIATSGSSERGDHIWLGGSTAVPDFAQVSVIADDIITADVLATAIVAGGRATLNDICDRFDIDVLAIDARGSMDATPGLRAALAA